MKTKHLFPICLSVLLMAAGCNPSDDAKEVTPPTPPPIDTPDDEPGSDDEPVITPDNPDIEIKWTLDFEENFDGTEVNAENWDMYDSPGHNNNGYRKPEAFTVEDGCLVITAKENDEGEIVSGGMAHKKNYLPIVRWEFRARCEDDPSETMSGVVLTWPQSNRWPDEGELDIFETGTQSPRKPLHSFLHYGPNNDQVHMAHDVDGEEWQEMALEWYEDALVIYLNGERVWTVTDKAVIPIWNHHICLQLDAFGTSLPAPVKMYVDYVRIYKGEIVKKTEQ